MSDSAAQTQLPPSEPGVEADDLNNTTIVMVGLISTALVLASALGVQALYQAYVKIDSARKAEGPVYSEAASTLNQQDTSLYGAPRAIPGQTGVYSLPIHIAMKLVVSEISAQQKSADAQPANRPDANRSDADQPKE